MPEFSITCKKCENRFDVEMDDAAGTVTCPECSESFDVTRTQTVENQSNEQQIDVDDLLPPQFLADDPDFIDYRVQQGSKSKVLLPDGKGGVKSVDEQIIRIEHRGRIIELTALAPAEKRRRQRIINIVSISLGIIILILFFVLIRER